MCFIIEKLALIIYRMCLNKYSVSTNMNVRSSVNNLRQGSQSAHIEYLYSTVNTPENFFCVTSFKSSS